MKYLAPYSLALGVFVGASGLCFAAQADTLQAVSVRLGWLDKITARTGEIEMKVGQTTGLGSLQIDVKSCLRRVPPDAPESAAFLQITETQPETNQVTPVFHGWMFASSPSLSAMDHGILDVWVLECKVPSGKEAGSSQPAPTLEDGSQPAEEIPDDVLLD